MSALCTQISILASLEKRRSRSSAAAIGHEFVLNGCPPQVQMRGIDALVRMPCDWGVAIFEEVIDDPLRNYFVRQCAIRRAGDLLMQAVDRGYARINRTGVKRLIDLGLTALLESGKGYRDNHPAHDLCGHLSEAVEAGCFDPLPDF